jgi:predicted acetyltransferase
VSLRFETLGRERTAENLAPIAATMGFEMPEDALDQFSRLPEYDVRLAAFEGDQMVGSLGSFTFELTTPGALVETAGLTGVGVYPTHRRRGVLRALMRQYVDDAHERGQPVSALWASEAPIYGRFGYGVASLQGSAEIDVGRESFVADGASAVSVRFVDEDEGYAIFPPMYDAVRAETPGMLSRSQLWWRSRRLNPPAWTAAERPPVIRLVVELGGEPAAYALYRQRHQWENGVPGGTVEVIEALGTTPAATRAVWRYLCDLDLMERVQAWMLPLDHPLLLFSAEPRRLGFRVGDALWVRLVDVGAALSRRVYADGPDVVLEVRDSFCPWNEGRWRVTPAGAKRARGKADVALDVAALGSAYLGGFTFRELARAGLADELTQAGAARADALFVRDRAPWCPEIF